MTLRSRTLRTLVIAASLASVGAPAYADVVTDWNAAALAAIRADRTPPPRASRALAILHASIYDAVNGVGRSYEPYFVWSDAPASASTVAAASAAAHKVLVTLFPAAQAAFDSLHAVVLDGVRDGPQKRGGVEWGEFVASKILAWRDHDQAAATMFPPASSDPGDWVPTPPGWQPYALPQWAFVAPFAMPTSSFFRPGGPPALDSREYASDYSEVKALGAAVGSTRTAEQDVIAVFWADGAGTETPPGHWNTIARDVAARLHNTLEQNARLFALLNIAMADAAISAWDTKYVYNFWRPVTAIRLGDADGNAETTADPGWNSFIVTPPFPDYVSGHSAFSGAASIVLARFYGTDDVTFSARSDLLPAVIRQFDRFSAAADEAASSRLYGGIHFRAAIVNGLTAGLEIGEWVSAGFLQPKGNRSRKGSGGPR